MSVTKWTMRDGTVIKIKDMTSSHINNCIKLLERDPYFFSVVVGFDSDSIDFDPRVEEHEEHLTALKEELERRNEKPSHPFASFLNQ